MTQALTELPDESLMLRYAGGDADAFAILYERHKRGLYHFLARQCAHAPWLDDVYQDVWMNVTRARSSYRPQAAFRTWLYQIGRNRLLDYLRRHEPLLLQQLQGDEDENPLTQLVDSRAPLPEQVMDRKQQAEAIRQALAELPAAQREAFLLREHGELSLEDIARLTGVLPETAKSRLRYAVQRLKQSLAGWKGGAHG